jgi:hypothetical protein
MTAELKGQGFRITATTPDKEAITGGGAALWQWEVVPLRQGSHALTLCVEVDVSSPGGVQPSSPDCPYRRVVKVTKLPRFLAETTTAGRLAWLLAVALLIGLGVAGVALLARRVRPIR